VFDAVARNAAEFAEAFRKKGMPVFEELHRRRNLA
jgi:hypothetical protein